MAKTLGKQKNHKKKPNKILETVHASMKGLHAIGLVDEKTMTEFNALCSSKEKSKNNRRSSK